MYVILGATGQVGGGVLRALLQHQSDMPLRIVGRCAPGDLPANVAWHQVDVTRDVEGLALAMQGARAVFVMNPVPPDARDVHHAAAGISRTIADAVVRAGRPRVVALSSQGAHLAEGTGIITALHGFEIALRGSGAPLTLVRSTFFMESWLPFAIAALETGQWWAMRDPADVQGGAVSARDVGMVIARCLLDPAPPTLINVIGARMYSENDAASIWASLAGCPIEVVPIAASERARTLESTGLGQSYACALAGMYDALDAGRVPFEPVADMHHGTTRLEDVLRPAVPDAPA